MPALGLKVQKLRIVNEKRLDNSNKAVHNFKKPAATYKTVKKYLAIFSKVFTIYEF